VNNTDVHGAHLLMTVELCDRSLIEVLLSDDNFLSVVGVLGYNPGLLKEMDFRADLEASMNHKEVRHSTC
jgi:hypothetical protein